MYLFVYKTLHKNGKYYIGRHSTDNLEDGYLGSGKWVSSIKDKSTLSREILKEASSVEDLYELEEYYIDLYWNDPLCMNMKKASIGWTPEDSKRMNIDRVNSETHNFLTRPDGTNINTDRVKNGTHPWQKRTDGTSIASDRVERETHNFLTRPDGTSLSKDRVKDKTHNFLTRPDGTSINTDRVKNGTHNFLTRPDGTSLSKDRVKNGTHPWQKRPDGTSQATDRVNSGTHHFLTRPDGTNSNTDRIKNGTHNFVGTIPCRNKKGIVKNIQKEEYYSQTGPIEDWEWVHVRSKAGNLRKK